MKEEVLKGLDKSCYVKTLKNGLDIIFIPYEDKKNYYMSYVTKFGSQVNTFIPINEKKQITVSNGIAHFLEHKMFEQEDGIEPFKFFSESGTGANAFTSFDSTQYICYGTKEFEKNLKYLIKFVNSPYFTDENVEKEKGIIKEEIKMYDDIPECLLLNKLREAIYQNHQKKIDIAGRCEDIQKITKEELYKCYDTFYQPNNMFIVIAGNFDKEKALKIIKESLDSKENKEEIRVKEVKEPKTVAQKEIELSINLKVPKIALGYKMCKDKFEFKNELELDLYLQMISNLLFGNSSLFRERVREKKLMTSLYYEWDTIKDYKTLFVVAETENPELLIADIEEELRNIDISIDDLERIKKVWIANEVKMIDFVDNTVNNIIDDKIKYNKIIDNKIEQIRKINKKKLDQVISNMNFNYRSKVILLPSKIIAKKK